jgi:hypothetical protein
MWMEEMMEYLGWKEIETARGYAHFGIKRLGAMMRRKSFPLELEQLQQQLAS